VPDIRSNPFAEVIVAPPTLYLLLTREHLKKGIEVAAQNVFDKPDGAYTGEISVAQLKDSGITWAILGHSERRQILHESDSVRRGWKINGWKWCLGVFITLLIGFSSLRTRQRPQSTVGSASFSAAVRALR
jgi:hypothetical protein